MAIPPCASVLDTYLATLPSRYQVRAEEDGCLLVTPFSLPDNTQLTVHVAERQDGTVEVSDLGETFDRLFLSGVNVRSDDRRLATIRHRFGVQIDGGEIVKADAPDGLPKAIDDVVNAVLDMAYLVYTRNPRATPTFTAEVEQFLMLSDVPYERGYEVPGLTDAHTFDYYVAARKLPLLVEALSTTSQRGSRERAQTIAFKVLDIGPLDARNDFRFVCLLDDRTPEHQDALTQRARAPLDKYLDQVVLWSERNKVAELLAA